MFQAWLKTVAYPEDCLVIPENVITDTLRYGSMVENDSLISFRDRILEKAGVVVTPEGGFAIEQFVETGVAKLA